MVSSSMIRRLQDNDIEEIAKIWLETNIEAHNFIPKQYWIANYDLVKTMLPKADVYVYDEDGIHGFVGLNGDHIEGVFVSKNMQCQGIGKSLLEYIKGERRRLTLNVYKKNVRALAFYLREGFKTVIEGTDEDTREPDILMEWRTSASGQLTIVNE